MKRTITAIKHHALPCLGLTLCLILLPGCTSGHLEYMTPSGETKTACETEFRWQPSVDKYALEYVLSYCAQQAEKQGNIVLDTGLLKNDLSIPLPPEGQNWSHQLAKEKHQAGELTDREYGYIVAYLDLGHDKSESGSKTNINKAKNDTSN